MNIIKADLQHLEDVTSLFDQYRVFYGQDSDRAACSAFIEERMTRKESIIFIAYDGEQATAFTQLYPSFTSIGIRPIYVLNDLFVTPEYRGKGAGRALLEHAFAFAGTMGATRVILQTHVDNRAAKALYESAGMELDRQYDHYVKTI
ncbi:GNAT family N-acetyltransferase [Paenibacillus bovis]|uniref:N-acetyltransferase domain-containing protein n=1 Tax=Paenibacillus bovis TaxID=1616788 RepID=A0A172ZHI4_9BACL|nr:GNAT family N-acetyltransferase [Paenibacillus bovis]ANF96989.1 hypothetical protein AR543_13895 [Paenibacillus bovis]